MESNNFFPKKSKRLIAKAVIVPIIVEIMVDAIATIKLFISEVKTSLSLNNLIYHSNVKFSQTVVLVELKENIINIIIGRYKKT